MFINVKHSIMKRIRWESSIIPIILNGMEEPDCVLWERWVWLGEVEKRGIVSPVAGVSVSYKKPVLFDDEVEITVSVKKYNGAVLELEYEFYNATRNESCTAASSKHCFTKDGKLVSLKREIPELDELFRKSLKGENA